jgi:succinate dehydrogenase / fumarate reductase cytochrome b subunit
MPLTAGLMSITHRMTGAFLSLGTLVLVYWLMAIAQGPETYQQAQQLLSTWYGVSLLFAWSFALFYHLLNGIRHLFWDACYGIDLKTAHVSGYVVLILTFLLTAFTWLFVFMTKGNLL